MERHRLDLERFYSNPDPWGYFSHSDDHCRRHILVSELSRYQLGRTLDIGCGNGFITEAIPASVVVGVDISEAALIAARSRAPAGSIEYRQGSLFDLPHMDLGKFGAIIVTGVLYRHYIGNSLPLVYRIVDDLLQPAGLLFSAHIDNWYFARFPYARIRSIEYQYRSYRHLLEVYRK